MLLVALYMKTFRSAVIRFLVSMIDELPRWCKVLLALAIIVNGFRAIYISIKLLLYLIVNAALTN